MDWKEILAALKAKIDEAIGDKTGDDRKSAIRKVLTDNLPNEYVQPIYDSGHGAATGTLQQEITTLRSEKKDLESRLARSETRVKELERGPADTDKRIAELQTQVSQLTEENGELKSAHKADRERWETERQEHAVSSVRERIRSAGHKRFDDPWFDLRLQEAEREGRLKAEPRKDADGNVVGYDVVLLQKGKSIPVQADGEEGLIKAYLEEVSVVAPKERVKSNADAGGGSGGDGSSGNAIIDQARKAAEALKPKPQDMTQQIDARLNSL